MTTYRQIQDEVLQTLLGYGLVQPRATFLTADVAAGDLAFSVRNVDSMDQGVAEVENETIFIESVDRSSNTLTIAPDGRGYFGTTAAAHLTNARVTFGSPWPRQRVKSAINDVIQATYPTLFGVAQTQFTFNPSVTTYSMPAEAERILMVTADVNGPSKEQQVVRRYSANLVAPTDDWATTNTITFEEAVSPGKTVTVTYLKQPSALVNDSDALTASGLRETAKLAIVYGACAQLVSYVDAARLPADTAQADEYDAKTPVGQASRVAGQLRLYYENELERERKRLRATTPLAINIRTR